MKSFFAELQRRDVYKVAAAYADAALLLIQNSDAGLFLFRGPESGYPASRTRNDDRISDHHGSRRCSEARGPSLCLAPSIIKHHF